jgi:hypothetical protein
VGGGGGEVSIVFVCVKYRCWIWGEETGRQGRKVGNARPFQYAGGLEMCLNQGEGTFVLNSSKSREGFQMHRKIGVRIKYPDRRVDFLLARGQGQ